MTHAGETALARAGGNETRLERLKESGSTRLSSEAHQSLTPIDKRPSASNKEPAQLDLSQDIYGNSGAPSFLKNTVGSCKVEAPFAAKGKPDCSFRPDPQSQSESARAWRKDAQTQRGKPLTLDQNGNYEVQKGDSLWGVAERLARRCDGGKPSPRETQRELQRLLEANKSKYPGLDCNPHLLKPGMRLEIPGVPKLAPKEVQVQGPRPTEGQPPQARPAEVKPQAHRPIDRMPPRPERNEVVPRVQQPKDVLPRLPVRPADGIPLAHNPAERMRKPSSQNDVAPSMQKPADVVPKLPPQKDTGSNAQMPADMLPRLPEPIDVTPNAQSSIDKLLMHKETNQSRPWQENLHQPEIFPLRWKSIAPTDTRTNSSEEAEAKRPKSSNLIVQGVPAVEVSRASRPDRPSERIAGTEGQTGAYEYLLTHP